MLLCRVFRFAPFTMTTQKALWHKSATVVWTVQAQLICSSHGPIINIELPYEYYIFGCHAVSGVNPLVSLWPGVNSQHGHKELFVVSRLDRLVFSLGTPVSAHITTIEVH